MACRSWREPPRKGRAARGTEGQEAAQVFSPQSPGVSLGERVRALYGEWVHSPERGPVPDEHVLGEGKPSSVIEYVRPHFRRCVVQRETLSCRCGHIVTAPAPARLADKTRYASGFVAHLVSKCNDSIPLYRLDKAYKQIGIPIACSTMCDLFHRAASELRPLYDAALALGPPAPGVHADETSRRA